MEAGSPVNFEPQPSIARQSGEGNSEGVSGVSQKTQRAQRVNELERIQLDRFVGFAAFRNPSCKSCPPV